MNGGIQAEVRGAGRNFTGCVATTLCGAGQECVFHQLKVYIIHYIAIEYTIIPLQIQMFNNNSGRNTSAIKDWYMDSVQSTLRACSPSRRAWEHALPPKENFENQALKSSIFIRSEMPIFEHIIT